MLDPLNPLYQAGGLVLVAAAWLTVHLWLTLSLAVRTELGLRALLALVPPLVFLAPWWGMTWQKRTWSLLWLVLGASYLTLTVAGQ